MDSSLQKLIAVFDDPNLISVGGLAPVPALAERAGLHELVADHVTGSGSAGSNAVVKVPGWWPGRSPARTASPIWTHRLGRVRAVPRDGRFHRHLVGPAALNRAGVMRVSSSPTT